jgi:cholesterol transport system auxiliary component
MKIKIALVGLFTLALSGCSLPFDFSSPPKSYYKLSADFLSDKNYKTRAQRIGVRDISSDGFVNSHKVLFTSGNGEVGYYQFANWVDSPAGALTDGLLLGLDRAKLFQFVSRTTSGAVFDYQINGDLIDFSHETAANKKSVHILFRSELVDLRTREVIATKLFELSEPVAQDNVNGAIFSFNLASQKLLSQIISWMDESIPKEVSNPGLTPAAPADVE